MQGKVEICGVNTARLPVLKNEEMMALLRRTKEGDRAAREQLICGNLRLVLSVIQRFLGSAASGSSRPSTTSTSARTCAFRPTACR